jgi:ribosomal protein S18 acetylase RimI-like enzyme
MNEPRLVHDQWLSDRLGKPAYHLIGAVEASGPWVAEVTRCLAARSLFADVKIAVDDICGAARVGQLGFALIDTNLRFSAARSAIEIAPTPTVGFANADMANAIGTIAEHAFVFDRFHRDSRTLPYAGAIKREWAKNFFAGRRGDWMVAASRSGVPIGFLQLLRSPSDQLVIDLIAVEAACMGQGIAQAMIGFAAKNCDVTGPIVVGTQVANTRSIRLYEHLGFRLESAQYVFHHHGGST